MSGGRWKRKKAERWTVGCDADNILSDLFDGHIPFKGKKLSEMAPQDLPAPIDVYNEFTEFNEHYSSAVFRTHWNNEKNARGIVTPGMTEKTFFLTVAIFSFFSDRFL